MFLKINVELTYINNVSVAFKRFMMESPANTTDDIAWTWSELGSSMRWRPLRGRCHWASARRDLSHGLSGA